MPFPCKTLRSFSRAIHVSREGKDGYVLVADAFPPVTRLSCRDVQHQFTNSLVSFQIVGELDTHSLGR